MLTTDSSICTGAAACLAGQGGLLKEARQPPGEGEGRAEHQQPKQVVPVRSIARASK